jgi:hypothetical protein
MTSKTESGLSALAKELRETRCEVVGERRPGNPGCGPGPLGAGCIPCRAAAALDAASERERKLRDALEKIAHGLAGTIPESSIESRVALASHMWTFSQETARAALLEEAKS